ncbi:MAG: aminoacyl-tRNA hydrolase [Pseudomonadota bacterium]
MKLVVGLGNPGADYAATRHNIGFVVADELARRLGGVGWSKKFRGLVQNASAIGDTLLLLKPQTYMNLSGESVQGACAFYRIDPTAMIVIHDDIDFELGRLQIKVGGGHGGHNGLRSIIQHLGADFTRLRLGVGRPRHDAADHVLSRFGTAERQVVQQLVDTAADAVELFLRDGAQVAQNRYNVRERGTGEP